MKFTDSKLFVNSFCCVFVNSLFYSILMSFLAAELAGILREKEMSPADLSRTSGISRAMLSKIATGAQVWVSPDVLARLAAGIDSAPLVHARLLRAHLLDECSGPGKDYIEIELRTKRRMPDPLHETAPPWNVKLPPKIEHYMNLIARNVGSDTKVRSIVTALGGLLEDGIIPE